MQLKAWRKKHHEAFQQCSIITLINSFNWIQFNLGWELVFCVCYLNDETCILIDDCMNLKLTASFVFIRLSIDLHWTFLMGRTGEKGGCKTLFWNKSQSSISLHYLYQFSHWSRASHPSHSVNNVEFMKC